MCPLLGVTTLSLIASGLAMAADVDRDGIDDGTEQALLERYAPTFYISGGECDGLPAAFSRAAEPQIEARNGTIYGQVFPASGGRIEIHYYHLWSRDCGRAGHALDAEHVSALVGTDGRALYWYAAAHEDTACDAGQAAAARAVDAVEGGPPVWISRGKHASYLRRESCGGGCGGDRCDDPQPMKIARIVNLGELGAPMNGFAWVESTSWNLSTKMSSDFDAALIARLEAESGVVTVASRATPWPVVRAGSSTADALETGNGHTGRALKQARDATTKWLRDRFSAVRRK